MNTPLATRIDALLPQTQCTRCGYPACLPYAEAIAAGEADINRCPPGGETGVAALAQLLGRAAKPLDPSCGSEAAPSVAVIDEAACIGCTKCIQACPVDAILGTGKHMHTVISAECTGCELCVEPCPVDCIHMLPVASEPLSREAVLERAGHARRRFEAHQQRVQASSPARNARADEPANGLDPQPARIDRAAVLAAIARGKAKRRTASGTDST